MSRRDFYLHPMNMRKSRYRGTPVTKTRLCLGQRSFSRLGSGAFRVSPFEWKRRNPGRIVTSMIGIESHLRTAVHVPLRTGLFYNEVPLARLGAAHNDLRIGEYSRWTSSSWMRTRRTAYGSSAGARRVTAWVSCFDGPGRSLRRRRQEHRREDARRCGGEGDVPTHEHSPL